MLRSYGPALVQEAQKAISYGQPLVEDWLQKYMFSERPVSGSLANSVSKHFGGRHHGSHGKRIDRNEARQQHLEIVDLEDNQEFQEEVLTLYHLSTITFEQTSVAKSVFSSNERFWMKNFQTGSVVKSPKNVA
ncbi:MAG: hypothetical protein OXC63_11645 [Aestuariivita sp.]|nr:hypothetical protein [Aestuariivita sp.]MCY4346901.1 hypothetical protein [Aestuariivita sp.]